MAAEGLGGGVESDAVLAIEGKVKNNNSSCCDYGWSV